VVLGATGGFCAGGWVREGVVSSPGEPLWELVGEVELRGAKPSSFQLGDPARLSPAYLDIH